LSRATEANDRGPCCPVGEARGGELACRLGGIGVAPLVELLLLPATAFGGEDDSC
jgi:hypothetical protein